jgi:tetratricopeptide (TPR) repeat protein
MPAFSVRSFRACVLGALVAGLGGPPVAAAQAGGSASAPAVNSRLDAQLFYQLLIGEIELRSGEAGSAYQIVLDAARRTRDEQLFRRATDIALQARAGDQALAAVTAWRSTLPTSLDAHRYLVQLLVLLNRPGEAVDPLRSLIQLTPATERAALIQSLPRFFARAPDRAQVADVLTQALQPQLDVPTMRGAARTAIGRAWLAVPNVEKALEQARRGQADDPTADGPALLAIEILPRQPAAEAIVIEHLRIRPDSHGVRLVYVRTLATSQRYGDAITQLGTLTQLAPELAAPWLTLGALHLELRQPAEATTSLQRYLALVDTTPPAAAASAGAAMPADEDDDGDGVSNGVEQGRTQAWLLLAQAAEQQRDFKAAEGWLAKVDSPQRALEVQARRASMLARQGQVKEARELIRLVPEKSPADARAKLLAEAQVLRDVKRWDEANDVLAAANLKFPDDVDLLYEQSMVAEKRNRMDEMEQLLRRVIQLKPDHHHAYNALGYSLAERGQRLPEAKVLIQKALELSPGEPFITDSLGWVEYRMGNREEALRLLRTAYQARPDPEIAAHLGEVLWVLGQRDEARRVLRDARSRDGSNDVLRETLARLQVDL